MAGTAAGPTAQAGTPKDHVSGVYVVTAEDGSALVERDGKVGLGAPAEATRWRLDRSGDGYLVRTEDRARGWVLEGVEPFSPVLVKALSPRPPRNEQWQGHLVRHTRDGAVVTITSAWNGWTVVPGGDYDPHLVVVPETFAPVTYTATRVGK
ncbi:hypothetical protein [Actinokineospora enzanensis]|uniref:hypothetical protein n=1 Tax=Actinokineospora enzanensis TaxID=155975 RepID=UPI0012EB413E|nr:hypothetical protein [Actinokineospora enzanensis]